MRRITAEAPENLRLQRVGVLKFVNEDVGIPSGKRPAHLVVVPQQVASGEDQIIEVQQRGRALVVPEAVHDGLQQRNKIGKRTGSGGPLQGVPCRAAAAVMGVRRIVQPVAVGLRQADSPGGVSPLALLAVGQEITALGEKVRMGPRRQERHDTGG